MTQAIELIETLFTGVEPNEFVASKSVCCFFCKRTKKTESVVIVDGEATTTALKIYSLGFATGNGFVNVPVCDECLTIISALVHPDESELHVFDPTEDVIIARTA